MVPSTRFEIVASQVTSSIASPRPRTTAYWPKPHDETQLAVIAMIVASLTSPMISGIRKRVITSVPSTPTRRPPIDVITVQSAPRAAFVASSDIG